MHGSAAMWRDQCDAALSIKEQFGIDKALGYLLGEKFLNYLRAAGQHATLAAELPDFVAAIKNAFEPWELREYLSGVRRLGPLAHTVTAAQFDVLREADAFEDDVVTAAEDVLLIERMKVLLL